MKKVAILNDTSNVPHHGCGIVSSCLSELLLNNNFEVIDINPCEKNWRLNKKFIKNLQMTDVVIVNGEGTLHHSQKIAMELIKIGKYVKSMSRIPVVLINATIQDNNNSFYDYLKYFDMIFVREYMSHIDLMEHGIISKVTPDLSFYSVFSRNSYEYRKGVGVTDSVFLDLSEKMYKLSQVNNYYFLPILTVPRFNFDNIFMMAKSVKYYASRLVNLVINKSNFLADYKNTRSLFYEDSYEKYINKISSLSFILIGRYHSLCFAIKTLTPFVVVKSNSFKIEGILNDIGIGARMVENINEANIEKYGEFSIDELEKIKLYIDQAPKKIERMFRDISKLVDNG